MSKVDLSPLIAQARTERKWLHCSYQDLWFSPSDLEEKNREGRFLWGPINWTLRDPKEHLEELERRAKSALDEVERFKNKIKEYLN